MSTVTGSARPSLLEMEIRFSLNTFFYKVNIRDETVETEAPLSDPQILWQQADRILQLLQEHSIHGLGTLSDSSFLETAKHVFDAIVPRPVRELIGKSQATALYLHLDIDTSRIPWELLHDGIDFLCCRFALGRASLSGGTELATAPQPRGNAQTATLISNPSGDLPESSHECGRIYEIFRHSTLATSTQWLNGRVEKQSVIHAIRSSDVLHFSGHAKFDKEGLLHGAWEFSDGPLSKGDLEDGPVPFLVFSNACASASPPFGEAGLSSLHDQFLDRGCLHFVGTFCAIPDGSSSSLSTAFYTHLLEGRSAGESLRLARLEHRGSSPHTSTLQWAPYLLYGNPETGLYGETVTTFSTKTLIAISHVDSDGSLQLHHLQTRLEGTLRHLPSAQVFIDHSDLILVAFDLLSDALKFLLVMLGQTAQERIGDCGISLRSGISQGETRIQWSKDRRKPLKIEGPAVQTAEILHSVCGTNQVLLTRHVFDSVRTLLTSENSLNRVNLSWHDHGAYRLEEKDEVIGICQIGVAGISSFAPPQDSPSIKRYVPSNYDLTLGWRPAVGLAMPHSNSWVLVEKLGQGGFGEVWRARHRERKETRVFKFCFRSDRVRSLKREMALYQMFSRAFQENDDVVRIYRLFLEAPPYYIEMEDVGGISLSDWWRSRQENGGATLEERIEVVAMAAMALQSAHDAGILHRDIKPSNILLYPSPESPHNFRVKLTDFGISQALPEARQDMPTPPGLTETIGPTDLLSHSGTALYMAPELLAKKDATLRSDIFSLGILLYQLIIGNLNEPLTTEWRDHIQDPLLREDLERCLAGNPQARYRSSAELATSLRRLSERRAERENQERLERRKQRSRGVGIPAGIITAFGLLLLMVTSFATRPMEQSLIGVGGKAPLSPSKDLGPTEVVDVRPSFVGLFWPGSGEKHCEFVLARSAVAVSDPTGIARISWPSIGRGKEIPIVGNWEGTDDRIGYMRTTDGSFFLDLGSAPHPEPVVVEGNHFIWDANTKSLPVVGNWCGGNDLPGYFRQRPEVEFVLFKSTDSNDEPFIVKGFDVPRRASTPFPLVGDWNNDRVADIGVFHDFRPSEMAGNIQLFVRDPDTWHYSSFSQFDVRLEGDETGIVGNWEGKGDRFGLFRPQLGKFHFFVKNNQEILQVAGISANGNESPISGDWNGDGKDECGFFRPPIPEHVLPEFHLFPQVVSISTFLEVKGEGFGGHPDEIPLVGKWDDKYWN